MCQTKIKTFLLYSFCYIDRRLKELFFGIFFSYFSIIIFPFWWKIYLLFAFAYTMDIWFNICVHFDLCIKWGPYISFIDMYGTNSMPIHNILLEFKQTITFSGSILVYNSVNLSTVEWICFQNYLNSYIWADYVGSVFSALNEKELFYFII